MTSHTYNRLRKIQCLRYLISRSEYTCFISWRSAIQISRWQD
jgi:hypothetical protein